eukprot:CAMPEP_0202707256 /NCGR_PEP_ID=MMETSP1385-20130828/19592_1 /ASSEMBLY_ACC=CAM_ASM_000861 /TAXON_ID=933848 /ORGANISM="Elphidium margaritaceum" /LENGTH=50 /DNA_ID=CAMNT_0049365927 /DNA_START=15 /DNA_END=164 /DNA_ORIENTATION=-
MQAQMNVNVNVDALLLENATLKKEIEALNNKLQSGEGVMGSHNVDNKLNS